MSINEKIFCAGINCGKDITYEVRDNMDGKVFCIPCWHALYIASRPVVHCSSCGAPSDKTPWAGFKRGRALADHCKNCKDLADKVIGRVCF